MSESGKTSVVFVLPSFAGGGAQRALVTFANNLDRRRFSPSILVFDAAGPWAALVAPDLPIHCIGGQRVRTALLTLTKRLRRLKPDVIISTMAYVNLALLIVKPWLSAESRIVVRDANSLHHLSSSMAGAALYRLGVRWLYRKADRIISPAHYMRRQLVVDLGLDDERIVVVPNPVDEAALRRAASPLRRIPGEGLRFVAVGRLTAQKGYDRLLNDFAALSADSQLTFLGDGEECMALQALAERLGVAGRVAFIGFDPNAAAWMAGADALLLSSRWEGLPNVALEALACGTRVIATPEAGGIHDILETCCEGALSVVPSGPAFVREMASVAIRSGAKIGPSLLPERFRLENAARSFAEILAF